MEDTGTILIVIGAGVAFVAWIWACYKESKNIKREEDARDHFKK